MDELLTCRDHRYLPTSYSSNFGWYAVLRYSNFFIFAVKYAVMCNSRLYSSIFNANVNCHSALHARTLIKPEEISDRLTADIGRLKRFIIQEKSEKGDGKIRKSV